MAVYQYYYTSYIHKRTGGAGFQVKAMSPGISPELQTLLAQHIAYRIPPTLAPSALDTHPVALRYFSVPTSQTILLSSRSSGKDEYGRPGNFFAHAVLLDASAVPDVPLIAFWHSPFWQLHDAEERDEITSLPVLAFFDAEPGLSIEQLWPFLDQDDRRTLLYKLLCAVVHSRSTQRRIIICDTDTHIALWIAAVSYLLPPAYRRFLTFATYHHDPRQAHYLITGTLTLAPMLQDSPAYFVLDAQTGQTGPVAPSAYAELAVQFARPALFGERMLPLFNSAARRFPAPEQIDEQLDLFALYVGLQYAFPASHLKPAISKAIHIALPSFESASSLAREDLDELHKIERTLRGFVALSSPRPLNADYRRVLLLLKTHHPSFDLILLQALQQFRQSTLEQDWLAIVVCLLLDEQFVPLPPTVEEALAPLALSTLSLARFTQTELALCERYQHLASLPSPVKEQVAAIVALTGGSLTTEQAEQAANLIAALTLEEYRALLKRCLPLFFRRVVSDEAHCNLLHALLPRSIALSISDTFWPVYLHALDALYQQPNTADRAIEILDFWFRTSPQAFAEGYAGYAVQQFFLYCSLSKFLQRVYADASTGNATLATRTWYPSLQTALPKKSPRLAILGHMLLGSASRQTGWEKLSRLDERTLEKKMQQLFPQTTDPEYYGRLADLYRACNREQFWSCYWKHFQRLLTSQNADQLFALFSFWFERAYEVFAEIPALPQEFFLGLAAALKSAAPARDISLLLQRLDEIARQEDDEALSHHWSLLLKPFYGGG